MHSMKANVVSMHNQHYSGQKQDILREAVSKYIDHFHFYPK